MILKQIPEDFVVKEKSLVVPKKIGKYCICELSKRNFNTEQAVIEISKQLGIPRKSIGYAGIKDKNAVTYQNVSIRVSHKRLTCFSHENVSLKLLGFSDEPISLGRLLGNKFEITVRGLKGDEKFFEENIINFFHNQRFSSKNVEVGRYLLKKDYASAVNLLKQDSYGKDINAHLNRCVNDFVGALRTVPKKILTIYVHAYQSYLWNKAVRILDLKGALPEEVPLPGFSEFDADNETFSVLNNILLEEDIRREDFLNKDIPWLSVEGDYRKTRCTVKDLKIGDFLDDELNLGKKKIVVVFELGKGEYATNVVEQLFKKR